MGTMLQDLKYGFRMLLKTPGVTFIAILALALGIGANTAIFSVVNAVLLRPLQYRESERLAIMWEKTPKMDTSVAYPNFKDWREQQTVFDAVAAGRLHSFNLTGTGEPERLQGRMVAHEFFGVLGVEPFKGRDFTADEDRTGANRTAILGHGFWQRRFGGDQSIVGKELTLNSQSYTVIGITPPDYRYGTDTDVFVPLGLFESEYAERGAHPGIYVLGRMKPGVTLEQARAGMDTLMAQLEQAYPKTNQDRRIHIESLYENTVSDVRPALYVLLGAVGFVLLIACANVANLLLARSASRQKEIAIRTALGAGRWRIVRQLLTESVILSLVGGAAGLLLALWGTDLLIAAVPDNIPRLSEAGVDTRVLVFTLGVSVLTGVVFGLFPALQASRPDLNESLKEGERGSTGARHRLRNALVVTEVAVALVLLVGAGLMVRSFWRLQSVDTGFDPKGILTMRLSVAAKDGEGQKAMNFIDDVTARVRALPGIEAAAFTTGLPFAGASEQSFWVDGRPRADEREFMMAVMYTTATGYFEAMNIGLKKGRYLDERDRSGSALVCVIDESLAAKAFPDEDPIGQRLTIGPPEAPPYEIVGVVEHVKHYGLEGEVPVDPQFYFSLAQIPEPFLPRMVGRGTIVVRTKGDPLALAGQVRQQVLAADPNQPVFNTRTMEEIVANSTGQRRFAMTLLTIFAGVALLLAAVGLYGVMSYTVTQRTHEIGIRMALGARGGDILGMVVRQGMVLVILGVVIGVIAALLLTRVMSGLLYGVSASDPMTFGGISLLLAGVAFLACFVPARRATRVDPMVALRYE
ncbi:MAG TPA: ABC transporter permease [Pyrinomonadaceae bacterium]